MSALLFAQINVFDGVRPIGRTSVLVRDGLINAIGRRLDPPPGARVVDGAGRTLLPGLIDAHIHVTERAGAQAIGFGVTTQLDMFADPIAARGPRAAAAARTDVADLRSAGTGATATGGHPAQLVDAGLFPPFPTVDRPEQAAAFVAYRIAEGSDYLKIFASGVPGEPGLGPCFVHRSRPGQRPAPHRRTPSVQNHGGGIVDLLTQGIAQRLAGFHWTSSKGWE